MKCNRWRVKILAMLLSLCLIVQSCSGCDKKLPATDELVICIDAHVYREFKGIIRDYTDTYPNVKITYEIVPRDDSIFSPLIDEDYKFTTLKQVQTEIMSGSGPDLFILDAGYNGECFFDDINKAMRGGVFCDLLPLFREAGISEEDFIKPVFDAGKVDGKQYVAPLEYQVSALISIEESHKVLAADPISDTAGMLAGIRAEMEVPGAGVPPFKDPFFFEIIVNPFYYTAEPLVDYDMNTIQIDTPLTGDILETGRFATGMLKQYKPFYQHDKNSYSGWFEFMHSNRYFYYSPYFMSTLFKCISTGYGKPFLDPIPSQDGGICAVISSFAGIRANSENKQNAVNMIRLLLGEEYQTIKNGHCFVHPGEGYPVRKGVLEQRLHDLVPGGENLSTTFTYYGMCTLAEETVQDFLSIESRITTARFPTPLEVNDILTLYYTGEIDLDTALLRMREFWEISLME